MISFGVHCRVQMFQAWRNHLVFCELMASGPMVPHSFSGLLEDTWPGMPQWSTLVLHHTCRRQQSRQVLQLSTVHKTAKYALLPATHVFVPIAFETLWPVNAEGAEFLSELTSHFICLQRSTRNKFPLAAPFHLCVAPQCHRIQGYISGLSRSLRWGLIS